MEATGHNPSLKGCSAPREHLGPTNGPSSTCCHPHYERMVPRQTTDVLVSGLRNVLEPNADRPDVSTVRTTTEQDRLDVERTAHGLDDGLVLLG